ncbi:C-mannosyltransferase dpy-19 like [Dissostichus eleginoides]|uniref:C-mannosyltransferase dpy-19 like n=1 Tax=Dissostichus eleginoides TaxID=100907 RepID=A0AAD9CB26_DISEL|nr:C-mannosyltransferase dpy-19 like [Dissostichus eleginoides]
MARHYSTQEALEIIMHSDCEDGSSSSSVDSEADTEEASESTEDASEVGTDQLESNSDSSEAESGGELEEAAAGWTSKNGTFLVSHKH